MSKIPLQSTKAAMGRTNEAGLLVSKFRVIRTRVITHACGTRYLMDTDPAGDQINPPKSEGEIATMAGRRPHAPWGGRCGFPRSPKAGRRGVASVLELAAR